MDVNIILAENIKKIRKEKGMTQDELAAKLGVTYQAVSKWENAKSAPDIAILPFLADEFGCTIDTLFSRYHPTDNTVNCDTVCTALPWKNDDVIRGVVCLGQRILQVSDNLVDKFTFEIFGDTKRVKSECNISVNGSVNGGCNAKNSITIGGGATGGINCGANVSVGGGITGGINCGANVSCGGDISGGINCGATVSCNNIKARAINCGSTISAGGDIHAESVKIRRGEIHCNTFNCDNLKGIITVRTKE